MATILPSFIKFAIFMISFFKNYHVGSGGYFKTSKSFKNTDELKEYLTASLTNAYEKKEKRVGTESLRFLERDIFLSVLDENWIGEQTSLKDIREGIWLRAYGQQDPDMAYFKEAHESFEGMKDNASIETVRTLFSLPDLVSTQGAR